MIVVTAATGNIGKALVEELLARKQKVRAVARNPRKLKALADKGAETVAVDMADKEALAKAFQGADAVFLLIPPKYDAPHFREYYNSINTAYADAVRQAGVKNIVNLSSIGAELPDKTGPIKGLHDAEQRLDKLPGVNIVHLRPTFFMENFFSNLGLIKGKGINGGPMKPDVKIPMIATRDIARVAADYLASPTFKGRTVRDLLGPRDLTLTEATRVLGQAIGKPDLPYVQFSYEDAQKAMVGMGISSDLASLFVEMYRGFNDGLIKSTQGRGPQSTTPTPLEEFAKTFAAAYQN